MLALCVLAATGVGTLSLEGLPILRDGVQTRQFCSYDRAGDNYDWDYLPLYTEPNGEEVIFDATGPGVLVRHHMNVWHADAKAARIRYYFDDEKAPRIDMDVSTFFSAANPLGIFRAPMAFDGGDRFRVLYHPMPFKRRLKVALVGLPPGGGHPVPWEGRYDGIPAPRYVWYQYTYHQFREAPGLASWTPEAGRRAVPGLAAGMAPSVPAGALGEAVSVAPGKAGVVARLRGAGTLSGLRLRVSPGAAFDAWLRITFDGAARPQVYAPVGSFFGGYRTSPGSAYSSLLMGYSPGGGYCRLPMPFWRSAVVEVENRGAEAVEVAAAVERKALGPGVTRAAAGHLFARFNREDPRTEGRDYRYLETGGAGHIVGHVTARWGTSMEEDERTYFDGSGTPGVFGDGFEDDHGMGWGLQNLAQPLWGEVGAHDGEGGIYRWFLPDLYAFSNGVRHGHQTYGPRSPRGHEGMYGVGSEESVTFYYAQAKPRLVATDELDVGDPASERAHGYRSWGDVRKARGEWWYDGERNNVLSPSPAVVDGGASFTGGSEFVVRVAPKNGGLRLRRRTDKADNRQRARVFVDGKLVVERPWYSVDHERTFRGIRWVDADFDVPARYTKGKSRVRISVEREGPGRWNEFRYWVMSYVR